VVSSRRSGGSWESNGPAPNDSGRDESEEQRLDRNLGELLQELRVAGLGVQVLFGFLLSLPFTNRFVRLSSAQRDVYLADLLLAAVASALLLAPVAYHRVLFRRHEKAALLRVANASALLGLAVVGLAITAAVVLDATFVDSGAVAAAAVISVFVLFAGLWFVLPLWRRARLDREREHRNIPIRDHESGYITSRQPDPGAHERGLHANPPME
jgi:O-antigen/teichoic acid export membrane protein